MAITATNNRIEVGRGYDVTGVVDEADGVEAGDLVVSDDGETWGYADSEGQEDVLFGIVLGNAVDEEFDDEDVITVRISGLAQVELEDIGCEYGEYVEASSNDGEVTVAEPFVNTDTSTDQEVEGLEAIVGRVKTARDDSGTIVIEVM